MSLTIQNTRGVFNGTDYYSPIATVNSTSPLQQSKVYCVQINKKNTTVENRTFYLYPSNQIIGTVYNEESYFIVTPLEASASDYPVRASGMKNNEMMEQFTFKYYELTWPGNGVTPLISDFSKGVIQAPPGTLIAINGYGVRMSKNGIFEIRQKDDVLIQSVYFFPRPIDTIENIDYYGSFSIDYLTEALTTTATETEGN